MGGSEPKRDDVTFLHALRAHDLTFFGAMVASISHEMNNVLATINELRGLMNDFLKAHEAGRPVDPSRFSRPVERIAAQVTRGQAHTGKLNRFAHSVDQARATIEVGQAIEQAVTLCERFATLKNVQLIADGPEEEIHVEGRTFDLLHILYRSVALVLVTSTPQQPVRLDWSAENEQVRLTVSAAGQPADDTTVAEAMWAGLSAVVAQVGGTVSRSDGADGVYTVSATLPRRFADPLQEARP